MSANVPEAPKKPLNVFFKIQKKLREENKAKGVNLSVKELADQAKSAYEKLPEKEKAKMVEQYNKEKEQY